MLQRKSFAYYLNIRSKKHSNVLVNYQNVQEKMGMFVGICFCL